MSQDEADLEFTAALLVTRIAAVRREATTGSGEKRGVVFLLGAGCSHQYGIPRFKDLLTALWEDLFVTLPDPSWSLESLRDQLDLYWQATGPSARRELLKHYLRYGQIHGQHCPGYRRLAQVAKLGGVRAFVNLNFDTLLEEALEAEGVSFLVSASFRQRPPDLWSSTNRTDRFSFSKGPPPTT